MCLQERELAKPWRIRTPWTVFWRLKSEIAAAEVLAARVLGLVCRCRDESRRAVALPESLNRLFFRHSVRSVRRSLEAALRDECLIVDRRRLPLELLADRLDCECQGVGPPYPGGGCLDSQ